MSFFANDYLASSPGLVNQSRSEKFGEYFMFTVDAANFTYDVRAPPRSPALAPAPAVLSRPRALRWSSVGPGGARVRNCRTDGR